MIHHGGYLVLLKFNYKSLDIKIYFYPMHRAVNKLETLKLTFGPKLTSFSTDITIFSVFFSCLFSASAML